MTLIDADKFLAYLIFSKHIDGLTCGEVKEAVEMSKVDVLDKIKAEAQSLKISYTDIDKDAYRRGINHVLQIIDKYRKEQDS